MGECLERQLLCVPRFSSFVIWSLCCFLPRQVSHITLHILAPVCASAAILCAFPMPGTRRAPPHACQPPGWQRLITPAYALHLEGARAGRPPTAWARVHLAVPACHLRLGGLPAEAAAELALRGSSVRGARRLPATAPAPPHLTHSRPSEQKLGARSW